LVVDDEPLLVSALIRTLARIGCEGIGAHDGLEALARVRDEPPIDLVLCDVRMPNMDGPTLLKELRALGAAMPFVFLTGYGDHSDAELRAMGAVAVCGKPTPASILRDVVRTLLETAGGV
jgi:CheY-like chemotaxis protein